MKILLSIILFIVPIFLMGAWQIETTTWYNPSTGSTFYGCCPPGISTWTPTVTATNTPTATPTKTPTPTPTP
jgi:hypothetical protein